MIVTSATSMTMLRRLNVCVASLLSGGSLSIGDVASDRVIYELSTVPHNREHLACQICCHSQKPFTSIRVDRHRVDGSNHYRNNPGSYVWFNDPATFREKSRRFSPGSTSLRLTAEQSSKSAVDNPDLRLE